MSNTRELVEQYERGGERLALAVRGLTPEDMACAPAADAPAGVGKWTIQQVAVHVADSELVIADRIKRVIAEDRPRLLAFDENRWMQRLAAGQRPAEEAAALVDLNRKHTARVLRSLRPEDFRRTGEHSERGELSLEHLVRSANDHLEHHVKFIHEKRKAMGKEVR